VRALTVAPPGAHLAQLAVTAEKARPGLATAASQLSQRVAGSFGKRSNHFFHQGRVKHARCQALNCQADVGGIELEAPQLGNDTQLAQVTPLQALG
jgi:hypothetical protein